jgi:hypothetical protein
MYARLMPIYGGPQKYSSAVYTFVLLLIRPFEISLEAYI